MEDGYGKAQELGHSGLECPDSGSLRVCHLIKQVILTKGENWHQGSPVVDIKQTNNCLQNAHALYRSGTAFYIVRTSHQQLIMDSRANSGQNCNWSSSCGLAYGYGCILTSLIENNGMWTDVINHKNSGQHLWVIVQKHIRCTIW